MNKTIWVEKIGELIITDGKFDNDNSHNDKNIIFENIIKEHTKPSQSKIKLRIL